MKDENFQGIVAGLNDAIAFVQGDKTKGHIAAGPDVKAIRAKTKLTQVKFASKLRLPVGTVRDWEQHRRSPDAPARTLLGMVDADPKAALALIEKVAGEFGLSLLHGNSGKKPVDKINESMGQ
ncbi:MAG: helix-turn-helix domain-containing protein [Sphingorhabdus sp.]|uniref:helix-turn-helix domain-containing protein n=1 Tax=Sphingorhabdus sp. TaxID=1902408 RepID=UPI0038FCB959